MLTLHVDPAEFGIFLAIVLRLSVILFMLPIFSAGRIPNNLKVCLILAMAFMLFPFIRQNIHPISFEPSQLFLVVITEVVFGLIFALSMTMIISAFDFAGELISFEMGFGFAQVADPQTGVRSAVIGVWAQLLALMVLFSLNGHHVVLRLIVESFKTVPVGAFNLDGALFSKVIILSTIMFVLALKLAAPVLTVLILTQIGLGLMSKFAPQINILATSFPVTIGIGILFLGLTVIIWGDVAGNSLTDLFQFLRHLSK